MSVLQLKTTFIGALSRRSAVIGGIVRKSDRSNLQERLRLFAERTFLALFMISSWPGVVRSHDIYIGLTSKEGTRCCDVSDCRPAQFKVSSAGVQMNVDNVWVAIPADRIQYLALAGDKGESGGGHWCGWADPTEGLHTHCVILPPSFVAKFTPHQRKSWRISASSSAHADDRR